MRVRVRNRARVRVRVTVRVRRANPNPNPNPNQNSWVVYQITIERIERPGSPGELQLGSLVSWQVTRTLTRALALSPYPPYPPAGRRRPVVITPSTLTLTLTLTQTLILTLTLTLTQPLSLP